MRRTINEIETSVAYRWILNLGIDEKITIFQVRKNCVRCFQDKDAFESIIYRVS